VEPLKGVHDKKEKCNTVLCEHHFLPGSWETRTRGLKTKLEKRRFEVACETFEKALWSRSGRIPLAFGRTEEGLIFLAYW